MPPRDIKDPLTNRLDVRRDREADVRFANYVGPNGANGVHRLQGITGNPQVFTASSLEKRTWAPGAQVMVATPFGAAKPVILGTGPPGVQGGGLFATRDYPAQPPSIPSGQQAWGFNFILGSGTASLWAGGRWVEDRGIISGLGMGGIGPFYQCINADQSGLISPGSLLFGFNMWDVDPAVVHSYSVPAETSQTSFAVYANGHLYWWRIPWAPGVHAPPMYNAISGATLPVELWRARTDFSGAAVIGTFNVTVPPAFVTAGDVWAVTFLSEPPGGGTIVVSGSNAYVAVQVESLMTGLYYGVLAMSLSGGGSTVSGQSLPFPGVASAAWLNGGPLPGGGSFGLNEIAGPYSLYTRPDTVASGFSPLWPSGGSWALDSVAAVSTNRAGTLGALFGPSGSDVVLIVNPVVGGVGGSSPAQRIVVDTTSHVATSMFLKG